MVNAQERAQRADNALRRIENAKKKAAESQQRKSAAERQRREKVLPVNIAAVSTAGPRASVASAATSGAHTPRPTSGVNPPRLSSPGGDTARPPSCVAGEAGPGTTISESELVSAPIYTAIVEDGQDRTALLLRGKVIVLGGELPASAAVPAGKAGSGNLFTVRELLHPPTCAVSDGGRLRVGVWLRGRSILLGTPPPPDTGEAGENAPTAAVNDGDVDEAGAHATGAHAARAAGSVGGMAVPRPVHGQGRESPLFLFSCGGAVSPPVPGQKGMELPGPSLPPAVT